jgi:WD40 repeat protein
VDTARPVATLGRHLFLSSPAFSADGKTLAACAETRNARSVVFWDVTTRRPRKASIPCRAHRTPLYSPDGRWLVLVGAREIEFLELRPKGMVRAEAIRNPTRYPIQSLAFSPDGKWLLAASTDKVVRLWDVESRKLLKDWEWQIGEVKKVAFAPDGMTAAAAGSSRKVVIWDLDL